MSKITILKESKTDLHKKVFKFNAWTFPEELQSQSGKLTIHVRGISGVNEQYLLQVGLDKGNESWIDDFITHFLYNPEYRENFKSINGEIKEWIEFPQKTELEYRISHLNEYDGKFKDFINLRSGKDQYSKLRDYELESKMEAEVLENPNIKNLAKPDKASAYRWILRGLKPDLAVRRVLISMEIERNKKRKPAKIKKKKTR